MKENETYPELIRCIEVVKKLRDPKDGCPWDLKQTHESLLPYLFEEAYEFMDATEKKNPRLMEEEIGDVLLQVLLHTTIGDEKGSFNLESTAKTLADKLIRRHPHVFEKKVPGISQEEIIESWQKIKILEKGERKYHFDEKLLNHPSLESALKIGQRSKDLNFDWKNYSEVIMKVEEEWEEVKDELPLNKDYDPRKVEEEIGDLLFSVSQLARHLNIDPELALRKANKKFMKRFNKIEDLLRMKGLDVKRLETKDLEEYWREVKNDERT